MAKYGEGDARWIVEERKDGQNLNNWHWSEKNVLPWAQSRLTQLLGDLKLVDDSSEFIASTSDRVDVTGEAIINNRKKKLIPGYELEIAGKWKGKLKSEGVSVEGSWKIPYLAEENADEEPEVQFTTDTDSQASQKAKSLLHNKGRKVLEAQTRQFVKEMQAGGPALADVPAQTLPNSNRSAAAKAQISQAVGSEKDVAKTQEKRSSGRIGQKRTYKTEETFYARAQDIFECFVNPQKIQAYTRSQAQVDAREGGSFSMFGGSTVGKILVMKPPTELVLEWRFQNWREGNVSKVVIRMEEPSPGTTVLHLEQTGIPDEDRFENSDVLETTANGWKQQIFQRIRAVFGYGLGL